MKKRIGFIGLGIMGRPMCKNLIDAGYSLTVWNRSQPGIDIVVGYGATAANSPKEVAEKSDVVITMVVDSADVRQVILGSNGVIEGVRPGMTVIDMSTISPKVTREIAEQLAEKDVKMLDSPVSGGDTGAKAGTLSIMVGGPEEAFNECLPIYEAMGKNIIHIGSNGAGQTVKLCNQIGCVLNILGVSESLVLAAKSGVDLEKMHQAVSAGAAGSWMMTNLPPKIMVRDFEPGFMVKHQQKDLRLVMEAAQDLGISLPGASLVHQLFHSVEADGNAEKGTQALVTALEKLADVEVKG
ncbi:NAD(P)-dependent oxidoreductase [bacterium]|nr:NAD(P)-dependent oxidoreductase [bacterium]